MTTTPSSSESGTVLGTLSLRQATDTHWDVLVIGTGMGGATFGWAMASAGQRVLFVEAGPGPSDLTSRGSYPELALPGAEAGDDAASRTAMRRGGRQVRGIVDLSGAKPRRFIPFIGAGSGGSSSLYGMAMNRLFPSDFEPARRHGINDGTVPATWPVGYDEMDQWYDRAERLFRIRGGVDPMWPSACPAQLPLPPATELDAGHHWLSQSLSDSGLHPYRLPLACAPNERCQGGCQGYLCAGGCRIDSHAACLMPAVQQHNAQVVYDCEAVRVLTKGRRVSGVLCRTRETDCVITADKVALAAGALYSPALLLDSANEDWPDGVANGSGWVGRGLMRHGIDLYAFSLPPDLVDICDNRLKTLSVNDFYDEPGMRYGSLQSFGRLPPLPMIMAALRDDLLHSPIPKLAPLLAAAAPLMRPTLSGLESRSLVLAALMEDLPSFDNRVFPGASTDAPGDVRLRYRLGTRDRERMQAFRTQLSRRFKTVKHRRIQQMENNHRIAHACGTCRFGSDPRNYVLDPCNRAHELDNLWVVDASFFPSSGGTNPSLTIAANALRVAATLCTGGFAERSVDQKQQATQSQPTRGTTMNRSAS